ncbi:hypothetical protein Bint_2157 [Brachyspira intermedia PWS/A]|uniref:Uncharacterized protein n=1 Tax=Brachyspira intermedia (strain ATCC 51140 / PWS/A) TaxID=1045858 RepID=G0ELJ2_BRAIP|nr:hypothetical protein [Brachyspira intermedia]AEM22768.1 hypothetical protein Bint_2157 [Brachyspira intermedia PWS/A]
MNKYASPIYKYKGRVNLIISLISALINLTALLNINNFNLITFNAVYLFSFFSVFMFINSRTVYTNIFKNYKKEIKNKTLFSFVGFVISLILYILITKIVFNKMVVFNYIYAIFPIMNFISIILANIVYFILEKLFINENKHLFNIKCISNILLISFVYTSVFILLYLFYESKYIIILLSISNSLLSSAILSVFNIMSSKFMNPWSRFIFVNAGYIISFILSLIISSIITVIFFTFTIKIFVFTSTIILLSFIISLLLAHYIKAYSYL